MACEIEWETSFRDALAQAKESGKLVLVSFLDPCCGACNRLKSSTLTAECVRDYMHEHFIAVKYESGADSDQFMRFGVTAKPVMVVLEMGTATRYSGRSVTSSRKSSSANWRWQ